MYSLRYQKQIRRIIIYVGPVPQAPVNSRVSLVVLMPYLIGIHGKELVNPVIQPADRTNWNTLHSSPPHNRHR